MWYIIALAYQEVTHSYGVAALRDPGIATFDSNGSEHARFHAAIASGGRRFANATIAALSSVFDVPPEMAASCGILLWLVTFAAVVPLGLVLRITRDCR